MDARPKNVTEILQTGSDQYLIPFFQRHYKWTKNQWERLWLDAVRLMDYPDKDRHFLGSMVCTPHKHIPGEVNTYQLIDGQQRVTTLTILLTALKNKAADLGMEQLVEQIHEGFLVHKWQKGTAHYRVVPRTGDREVLFGIIDNKPPKTTGANRIKNALRYFKRAIDDHLASKGDPKSEMRGLFSLVTSRLSMVVITIDDENPYEIFWSLNGKGLPLLQSDLIRNFIFMQIRLEEQEQFNETHWNVVETLLGETTTSTTDATKFYRNYLMRNGDYVRQEDVFREFRNQYSLHDYTPTFAAEDLIRFAEIYDCIRNPAANEDSDLATCLSQLQQLDQATCHPLVMNLIARCNANEISRDSLLNCLNQLQSFVLRRSICGESTRQYGKLFVEAITKLDTSPQDNIRQFLLGKQWPDDAAFVPSLGSFDLYRRERKMTALILATLENSYGSKEAVDLSKGNITIEHVMPRNVTSGKDSQSWRDALGSDWQDEHKKHIDTIGNLSLTGYNSELSNSSFEKKKKLFKEGNLLLNRYFEDEETWDADKIEVRGHQMSQEVAAIWTRPEGQPYVPTENVSQEQKLFFTDFWTDFLDVWAEKYPEKKRPNNAGRSYVTFRSSRYRFWYYLELNSEESLAYIGLYFSGKHSSEFMAALWDDIPDGVLEALDERLESENDYHQPTEGENGFDEIYIEKQGLSFKRKDWPQVHRWFLRAFEDFQKTMEPFVIEVDPMAYEESDNEDDTEDGDDGHEHRLAGSRSNQEAE